MYEVKPHVLDFSFCFKIYLFIKLFLKNDLPNIFTGLMCPLSTMYCNKPNCISFFNLIHHFWNENAICMEFNQK